MNRNLISTSTLMLMLAACGKEDSLFSGFSLVVIIVIGLLIVRHFAKKD